MRNKIIIATGKSNYKGNQNRIINLAFSDTAAYPIPRTNFDIKFREFRFECSHMFTLEFPSVKVLAIVIAIAITIVIVSIVAVVAAALVIIIIIIMIIIIMIILS